MRQCSQRAAPTGRLHSSQFIEIPVASILQQTSDASLFEGVEAADTGALDAIASLIQFTKAMNVLGRPKNDKQSVR